MSREAYDREEAKSRKLLLQIKEELLLSQLREAALRCELIRIEVEETQRKLAALQSAEEKNQPDFLLRESPIPETNQNKCQSQLSK